MYYFCKQKNVIFFFLKEQTFSSFSYNTIRVKFSLERRDFGEARVSVDPGLAPEPAWRAVGCTDRPSTLRPSVTHSPRDGPAPRRLLLAPLCSREVSNALLSRLAPCRGVGSKGPAGRKPFLLEGLCLAASKGSLTRKSRKTRNKEFQKSAGVFMS